MPSARHCGVTFAGLKSPASSVYGKGRRTSSKRFHAALRGKGLHSYSCARMKNGCSYISATGRGLQSISFRRSVRAFLARFGYEYGSAEEALEQLKCRMSGEFPHEIGRVPRLSARRRVRLFARSRRLYSLRRVEGVRKCGRSGAHVRAVPPPCSACICRHMDRGRSLTQIFNVV